MYSVKLDEPQMLLVDSFNPRTSIAKLSSVATMITVWHLEDQTADFSELIVAFHEWRSGWCRAPRAERG